MGIDMTNGYPKSLQAWLAASFGLELGLAVLAFAMTWTASAYGHDTASAVLTLTVAPAVVLGLLGGLLADRVGPRRTMIVSSLGLVAISVILAGVVWGAGTSPALLFVIAASMGTASAFFRPASAVFARLFVADRELGTAMARVGMAGQLARTIGPPLGGVLIGMLTLAGVAWIGAAGAAVMLWVLLLIRVPRRVQPSDVRLGVRGILEAMSAVRSRKDVPALLASVAIIAGAVIPVVALGIPLAARERGWSASEAGLIEAGWIAGGLVCTAWFGWKGTLTNAWKPMFVGPIIIALGLGLLAIAPRWEVAVSSTVFVGTGVVLFTAHAFPTYLLLAPATMLSRFQSLLLFVQQAPQLVVAPLVGFAGEAFGMGAVIGAFGALALPASLLVVSNRRLRDFRL
ncbi:MFS transporter [Brevibacterium otitidis]|uniref:MFS transporter n=1 Tax=Brevibacterium otitidis TaxID=53364 RepID=A0ABV5X4Y1_9MICO|nr:MFS transporter [Brevibacterium otitidis]